MLNIAFKSSGQNPCACLVPRSQDLKPEHNTPPPKISTKQQKSQTGSLSIFKSLGFQNSPPFEKKEPPNQLSFRKSRKPSISLQKRPSTFSPKKEDVPAKEHTLKMLNDRIKAYELKGTYIDLKAMRDAERTFVTLNKSFEKMKKKSVTQIEALQSARNTLDAKMKDLLQFPEVKKVVYAEKLIANYKGRKSRNVNVTARQMLILLQDRLLAYPANLKSISKVLARQINEIMENPEEYRGKNLQLKAKEKNYLFYSGDQIPEELSLDFFLWIEVADDGNEVEVFIVPEGEKTGLGANKEVFKAQSFQIPFKIEPHPKKLSFPAGPSVFVYERTGTYTPKVMLKPRVENEEQNREAIDREISVHNTLHEQLPAIKLISPLKKTKPAVAGTKNTPLYSQDWYNFNLNETVHYSYIPLDVSKSPKTRKVDILDKLKIIRDTAEKLSHFHKSGYTHQDVKPQNIFVRETDDKTTLEGTPADYDLVQEFGIKFFACKEDKYTYWDALSNHGIATSFTDVYGLTQCLIEALIPEKERPFLDLPLTEEGQNACLLNFILKRFPTVTTPSGYSKASLIKWFETQIKKTIQKQNGNQEVLQHALAHIKAVQGALALLSKVISINQELEHDHPSRFVWNFIRADSNFGDANIKDACLLAEIQAHFNIKESHFETHVTSKIPNWDSLTNARKIETIKERLVSLVLSDTLIPDIRSELEHILKRLENRCGALEFMRYLSKYSEEKQNQCPLYHDLINPTRLGSQEQVFKDLYTQISMIGYSDNNTAYQQMLETCREIPDTNERRKSLKRMLEDALKDSNLNVDLKKELKSIFDKIIIFERTMDFAIEITKATKMILIKVAESRMSMKSFIDALDEIKANLV